MDNSSAEAGAADVGANDVVSGAVEDARASDMVEPVEDDVSDRPPGPTSLSSEGEVTISTDEEEEPIQRVGTGENQADPTIPDPEPTRAPGVVDDTETSDVEMGSSIAEDVISPEGADLNLSKESEGIPVDGKDSESIEVTESFNVGEIGGDDVDEEGEDSGAPENVRDTENKEASENSAEEGENSPAGSCDAEKVEGAEKCLPDVAADLTSSLQSDSAPEGTVEELRDDNSAESSVSEMPPTIESEALLLEASEPDQVASTESTGCESGKEVETDLVDEVSVSEEGLIVESNEARTDDAAGISDLPLDVAEPDTEILETEAVEDCSGTANLVASETGSTDLYGSSPAILGKDGDVFTTGDERGSAKEASLRIVPTSLASREDNEHEIQEQVDSIPTDVERETSFNTDGDKFVQDTETEKFPQAVNEEDQGGKRDGEVEVEVEESEVSTTGEEPGSVNEASLQTDPTSLASSADSEDDIQEQAENIPADGEDELSLDTDGKELVEDAEAEEFAEAVNGDDQGAKPDGEVEDSEVSITGEEPGSVNEASLQIDPTSLLASGEDNELEVQEQDENIPVEGEQELSLDTDGKELVEDAEAEEFAEAVNADDMGAKPDGEVEDSEAQAENIPVEGEQELSLDTDGKELVEDAEAEEFAEAVNAGDMGAKPDGEVEDSEAFITGEEPGSVNEASLQTDPTSLASREDNEYEVQEQAENIPIEAEHELSLDTDGKELVQDAEGEELAEAVNGDDTGAKPDGEVEDSEASTTGEEPGSVNEISLQMDSASLASREDNEREIQEEVDNVPTEGEHESSLDMDAKEPVQDAETEKFAGTANEEVQGAKPEGEVEGSEVSTTGEEPGSANEASLQIDPTSLASRDDNEPEMQEQAESIATEGGYEASLDIDGKELVQDAETENFAKAVNEDDQGAKLDGKVESPSCVDRDGADTCSSGAADVAEISEAVYGHVEDVDKYAQLPSDSEDVANEQDALPSGVETAEEEQVVGADGESPSPTFLDTPGSSLNSVEAVEQVENTDASQVLSPDADEAVEVHTEPDVSSSFKKEVENKQVAELEGAGEAFSASDATDTNPPNSADIPEAAGKDIGIDGENFPGTSTSPSLDLEEYMEVMSEEQDAPTLRLEELEEEEEEEEQAAGANSEVEIPVSVEPDVTEMKAVSTGGGTSNLDEATDILETADGLHVSSDVDERVEGNVEEHDTPTSATDLEEEKDVEIVREFEPLVQTDGDAKSSEPDSLAEGLTEDDGTDVAEKVDVSSDVHETENQTEQNVPAAVSSATDPGTPAETDAAANAVETSFRASAASREASEVPESDDGTDFVRNADVSCESIDVADMDSDVGKKETDNPAIRTDAVEDQDVTKTEGEVEAPCVAVPDAPGTGLLIAAKSHPEVTESDDASNHDEKRDTSDEGNSTDAEEAFFSTEAVKDDDMALKSISPGTDEIDMGNEQLTDLVQTIETSSVQDVWEVEPTVASPTSEKPEEQTKGLPCEDADVVGKKVSANTEDHEESADKGDLRKYSTSANSEEESLQAKESTCKMANDGSTHAVHGNDNFPMNMVTTDQPVEAVKTTSDIVPIAGEVIDPLRSNDLMVQSLQGVTSSDMQQKEIISLNEANKAAKLKGDFFIDEENHPLKGQHLFRANKGSTLSSSSNEKDSLRGGLAAVDTPIISHGGTSTSGNSPLQLGTEGVQKDEASVPLSTYSSDLISSWVVVPPASGSEVRHRPNESDEDIIEKQIPRLRAVVRGGQERRSVPQTDVPAACTAPAKSVDYVSKSSAQIIRRDEDVSDAKFPLSIMLWCSQSLSSLFGSAKSL